MAERADDAVGCSHTRQSSPHELVPGGLRVREATPRRLGQLLDKLAVEHRTVTAKQARTILTASFSIAVREGAVPRNPVRDTEPTRVSKTPRRRANGLTGSEGQKLREQLATSTALLPPLPNAKRQHPTLSTRTVSQWARDVDLTDVIITFLYTGLRRAELLGLRWVDYDTTTARPKPILNVVGHVVRAKGRGLIWEERTKSEGGRRLISVPPQLQAVLEERRRSGIAPGELIFPNSVGMPRDADNLAGQWRRVRGALGLEWVELHDFRRTVASILGEGGLTSRVTADHLGHANISMTHHYQASRPIHFSTADVLDAAFGT